MKIESIKVLGIDVSKDNICCCILDSYPKGGLANYWKQTRIELGRHYPRFYSAPPPGGNSVFDFRIWVKENQCAIACLEPTGVHYSKFWVTLLEKLSIQVLLIGHVELKRYRDGKNISGRRKSDEVDALAMAAYPHDPEHHTISGKLDLSNFLMVQGRAIARLRELNQEANHLARIENPIVNYLRQRLAWEFPEVAQRNGSSVTQYVPPLFGWLAQDTENTSTQGWNRMEKEYEKSVAPELGLTISDFTRAHGKWLVEMDLWGKRMNRQIEELLAEVEFEKYQQVFDNFGFGLRIRARLLSRIYPFEGFLLPNGRLWIERTQKMATPLKGRARGSCKNAGANFSTAKTTKRNKSRDIFKLRLGMGTVVKSSGDTEKIVPGGSLMCRQALWQYVLTGVETGRLPQSPQTKILMEYRDDLKSRADGSGKPLLNGRHIQMKLMSKTTNLLFTELCKMFVVSSIR